MRDNQITGMAGEFLTAGKLSKKGLTVSITFGNAKTIDILAYNPKNEKTYVVQVKTSRKQDNFRELKGGEIKPEHVFIFLNEFENNEDFFIVKGSEILNDVNKFFGSTYNNENLPEKRHRQLEVINGLQRQLECIRLKIMLYAVKYFGK
jgi:hypothetical protein